MFTVTDPDTGEDKTYVSRSQALEITGLSRGALERYEVRDPEIVARVQELRHQAGAPLKIVFELSEMHELRKRVIRQAAIDQADPLAHVAPPPSDFAESAEHRGARRLEEARTSLGETQQVHAEMLDDLTARARRIRGQIELLEADLIEVEKDRRRVMRMAGHTADAEQALGEGL